MLNCYCREEPERNGPKDDKPKSIFEEFNIPKPTIKMNPFTGN